MKSVFFSVIFVDDFKYMKPSMMGLGTTWDFLPNIWFVRSSVATGRPGAVLDVL